MNESTYRVAIIILHSDGTWEYDSEHIFTKIANRGSYGAMMNLVCEQACLVWQGKHNPFPPNFYRVFAEVIEMVTEEDLT